MREVGLLLERKAYAGKEEKEKAFQLFKEAAHFEQQFLGGDILAVNFLGAHFFNVNCDYKAAFKCF